MVSTEIKESVLFEVPPSPVKPKGIQARTKPRLKEINRSQILLRPTNIEELVPPDHEVRAIWELSGQMDLSPYYEDIQSVEGKAGRDAHDPRVMICLWIYAYKEGISSAREIVRLCEYHPGFQWLTGMNPINHHTLSDFRVRSCEKIRYLMHYSPFFDNNIETAQNS